MVQDGSRYFVCPRIATTLFLWVSENPKRFQLSNKRETPASLAFRSRSPVWIFFSEFERTTCSMLTFAENLPFNVPPKNYPRNNDDCLFKTCALRTIFIYRALTEHDKLDGTLSSRSCAPCQVLTEPKARSIPGKGLIPKSECALHSNGTPWV